MPKIQVGDVNLHYDVAGKGEPLLMIMGLGASSAQWDPELVTELARTFRVITFDNRGTGQSDKPDVPYSIEMFADDAAGVLEQARSSDRAHLRRLDGRDDRAGVRAAPSGRTTTLTLGCTTAGGTHSVPPPPESLKILTAPREGVSPEDVIRRGWPLGYTPKYIAEHRDVTRSRDSAPAQASDAAVRIPAPARSDLHAADLGSTAANQGADAGHDRRAGRADPGEELRDTRGADSRRETAHHPGCGTRVHVRRPRGIPEGICAVREVASDRKLSSVFLLQCVESAANL